MTITNGHRRAAVADVQLLRLLAVLLSLNRDRCSSLGVAALGLSSRAGGRAKMSAVALPALAQDKVIVGRGAHGVKYVGFVRYLELFSIVEHLAEAEVIRADVLHVVLFKSSLNHLRRVVLTGQQYALVDVSVAERLHTDPDDTGVSDLLVVNRQHSLRRAAGRRLWTQNQRGGAQVWM